MKDFTLPAEQRFGDKIVQIGIGLLDFTLPSRDLEILIRAVLFKASFSPRSGHIVEIGSHSIVVIVT